MRTKIGTATCLDCSYPDCDVGLDKNGHPFLVCWSEACGGEQYFSKGKPAKVARLLSVYRPLHGKPTADELRAKYGIAPAAAPAADHDNGTRDTGDPLTAAPAPKSKRQSGLIIQD